MMPVFWDVTPCSLVDGTDILESVLVLFGGWY